MRDLGREVGRLAVWFALVVGTWLFFYGVAGLTWDICRRIWP